MQRLFLVSNSAHMQCEYFCIIFSTSAVSRPNLFSSTGITVMISWIASDRPVCLSRLRAFPYVCFKFYITVHIEPNSIQAINVISVVQAVYDLAGCISIWSSWSSEHYLRQQTRLNLWSGQILASFTRVGHCILPCPMELFLLSKTNM